MSEITSQEYRDSVESIAQDILDELEVKTQEDWEDNKDAATDKIHENVDSSQWIIYTYRNFKVLEFASNRDHYEDVGIDLDTSRGFDAIVAQVAFWAMYNDVQEKLEELANELPETADEEEDEETESDETNTDRE